MRNLHCTKWAPVPIVAVVANGAPHRLPWPWAPGSPPLFADQDGAAQPLSGKRAGHATCAGRPWGSTVCGRTSVRRGEL